MGEEAAPNATAFKIKSLERAIVERDETILELRRRLNNADFWISITTANVKREMDKAATFMRDAIKEGRDVPVLKMDMIEPGDSTKNEGEGTI